MFRVEGAHRMDLSNPPCTSKSCSWSSPGRKDVLYMELEKMNFVRPSHSKDKKGVKPLKPKTKSILPSWDFKMQSTDKKFQTFLEHVRKEIPTALFFLPGM